MKTFGKYSRFIPYLYYIIVTVYWFSQVNKTEGISAFPILLFGIPFLWQIIRPSQKLNFALGIIFVCLSSYLILAYLSDLLNIVTLNGSAKQFIILGGVFVITNFVMALWMIRNSINRSF